MNSLPSTIQLFGSSVSILILQRLAIEAIRATCWRKALFPFFSSALFITLALKKGFGRRYGWEIAELSLKVRGWNSCSFNPENQSAKLVAEQGTNTLANGCSCRRMMANSSLKIVMGRLQNTLRVPARNTPSQMSKWEEETREKGQACLCRS